MPVVAHIDFAGRPQDVVSERTIKQTEAIIGDAATVVGFNHLAILHAVDHENVQEGYRHLLEDADDSLLDLAALADVDAAHVTTSMLLVTRKMMEAMPKIKMIVRHGVGYDNVDLEAADELGVAICNVPDYGTEEVTDMAFTHTLGLLRGAYNHTKNVREGVWNTFGGWPGSGRIQRIRGLQVGLVGFGRMGKAYTIRAKAFGMEVQYFDPYRPQGEDKSMGVRACETLEELLRTSDVVNLHCALTEETRHIINEETLKLMKPTAILVNTARGGCVDMAAVKVALDENRLGGAGIDVLEVEQMDDFVRGLAGTQNLFLSPHAAWFSAEASEELNTKCILECKRVALGPNWDLVDGPAGIAPSYALNVVNHPDEAAAMERARL